MWKRVSLDKTVQSVTKTMKKIVRRLTQAAQDLAELGFEPFILLNKKI